MTDSKLKGFTLLEVSAAVTLFVLTIGLALTGYMFTLKNINQGDVQGELDIDVQVAMERLKVDLRLSSLDKMFYHPEGSGPYEAISFPIAYDSDNDGILEKDGDLKILWDETIVYHIRPTTPHQLVKTVFRPRDNSLTDAQRQEQLESVVKYGDGNHTYNNNNVTSTILFENLLDWSLSPKAGQFDAYAAEFSRDRASLGYILLDSGSHDITFTTVGKNASSTGYKIGVDQLFASASESPREGEAQLPVKSESGANAVSQYVPVGSWKGNHHLSFPATAASQSFTLTLANDRWEETNFSGTGYLAENTQVTFSTNLAPKDFVVMLDGMTNTWEAAEQTDSTTPTDPASGEMTNWIVRVMQKGSELADNGSWFSYNGRQCSLIFSAGSNGRLKIGNVFIGESASTTNASLDFKTSTAQEVLFGGSKWSLAASAGSTFTSDWVDFEINKEKNYIVSYRIANNVNYCHPSFWPDNRGSVAATCMIVTNGTGAVARDKTWSDRTGISPISTNGIFGLKTIAVTYAKEGTYTSKIFDTQMATPHYGDISWNADVPTGTTLAFKIRTGSQSDLSDASDWSASTSFNTARSISASYKRYVQFQALMTSDTATGQLTPQLKDVTINWTGSKQLVDIGGIFTKGPNYGMFEVTIDNEPLKSAIVVNLEIYEEERTHNNESTRVTSSLKIELTPRNSGL